MEAQNIYIEEVRRDISEIKKTLEKLAEATTTMALHGERFKVLEDRIIKTEQDVSAALAAIRKIEVRCYEREHVYSWGKHRMESPGKSHDDWWDQLLGSAAQHGLWILVTALITLAISNAFGR